MPRGGSFECHVTPDRIVFYKIVGTLDVDTAARLSDAVYEAAAEIDGPLRLLVDISQAQPTTAQARHYLMQILLHPRLSRIAVVGASTVNQALVIASSRFTHVEDRLALFQRQDEARRWLESLAEEG